MNGDMKLFCGLGFIQFAIQRAEPRTNLKAVDSALQAIDKGDTHLIVLPEMWSCGFAYGRLGEMADATDALLAELAVLARRHNCIFAGSLPEKIDREELGRVYNTLYIVGAEGVVGSYRKQRIFAFGGEGEAFAPGEKPHPVATTMGSIGCLVCYDLRFPELARIQCQQGADLLVCSAEWPTARIEHWRTLLKARAIENQTFLVACNACGSVDGVEFGGYSAIIDPEGNVLVEAAAAPYVATVQPDWRIREDFRSRFRSFAAAPYSFSDVLKICYSAEDCLARVARRKTAGQRVRFYEIEISECRDINLKSLEDARRQGDFLLVGIQPAGGSAAARAREGRAERSGELADSMRFVAALGCVDAVCLLGDFSPKDLKQLGELFE
jgi:predicted amidohydrolase